MEGEEGTSSMPKVTVALGEDEVEVPECLVEDVSEDSIL